MRTTKGLSIISLPLLLLILSILGFSACRTVKDSEYFKDLQDSSLSNVSILLPGYTENKIQPNDNLSISIQTIDMMKSESFSGTTQTPSNGATGASQGANVAGYIVDKNGEVEIPIMGRIKVGGMTISQVREIIREKATQYYTDPIVNVRCLNAYINVLGEVNRPGPIYITADKLSIIDAISLAGDLTIYGKRTDILLVREVDGKKVVFSRFNITSKDIFSNPNFYLQKGDDIYVLPNKSKITASDASSIRTLTIFTSVTSLAVTITALILSRVK